MPFIPTSSVQSGIPELLWENWTPVLTASSVNPTLGSASTQEGRYLKVGNLCVAIGHIRFGTSGAAAGTGEYIISTPLPFGASADTGLRCGYGMISDETGTIRRNISPFQWSTANAGVKMMSDAAFAFVGATSPWTWAASDDIAITLIYEID